MFDTASIHSVIRQTRRRLRIQRALESAVTTSILSAVLILVTVFLFRRGHLSATFALGLVLAAVAIIGGVALLAAVKRIPALLVASRLDRASNLADRLATACAFEQTLASKPQVPEQTIALMGAAIKDAIQRVGQADIRAAAPWKLPKDAKAAAIFGVVCAALSGLNIEPSSMQSLLVSGAITLAKGSLPDTTIDRGQIRLETTAPTSNKSAGNNAPVQTHTIPLGASGLASYQLSLPPGSYRLTYIPGADCKPDKAGMPCTGGTLATAIRIAKHRVQGAREYRLQCGDNRCTLNIDIPRRGRQNPEKPALLADDDLDYVDDLLRELRREAKQSKDKDLQKLIDKLDQLLAQMQRGELTKSDLLRQLADLEQQYKQGSDPSPQQTLADLKQTGKELTKTKQTRQLGKALTAGNLEQAKQQMEELAKKIDSEKLAEKDRKAIAKALEKSADKFEKLKQQRDENNQKAIEKQKSDIRKLRSRLEKTQSPREKRLLTRQLKDKERRLKRLEREKQQQQAAQKRRLKRLHRNMKRAAKQMQQNNTPQNRKQASRTMRDAAEDTGQVDRDVRKVATQKKVASQLEDLKEAMRRAKQKGKRGPKDLFGKNRRKRDFRRRAQGQKGQRSAWKPGQRSGQLGQNGKPGQNGQPGQNGKRPGGDHYGDQHDPDLLGDATPKAKPTKDTSVSGVHGRGPGTRETILSAAQKGFSNVHYRKVFARYKTVVEDVMQTEKVPPGYKYYIKKYFQKIKPRSN